MSEEALRELFERATELTPGERTAFLTQACGGDSELLEELTLLLAADAAAESETFWQHSALRNEVIAERGGQREIGEIIGNYRLVERIGQGGMGSVYRAVRIDAAYDKSVAVKLIDGLFQSTEVINHFRAERQILANLEHPNIARLLDGGARADGLPYLVMEYVEGISPYEYCRAHQLSTAERLRLFRQICSAVHFAHQHMVIHRDLKPANILVTEEGSPKLLDFGIAKVLNPDPLRAGDELTQAGMLKFTARYASPEQIRGEAVTTASDVYALGVILYELLAGHSPYGDNERALHEMMSAVCEEEPSRPSVWAPRLKGDLDNIILRAIRKAPLQRYASVDQFSEDILRYLEGRPVQARGDAPLYLAARFVQRNRVAVATAALVLCALCGGLIEVSLAGARADRRFSELHQLAHSVVFDYADAIDRLPGSTPVRERLVKDALTYLDSLSKEADTPVLQREVVDAYVRVSDVQGNEYQNNLGNTAGALASAQKAVAAAEKLLKHDKSLLALNSAASAFSTDGSLLYSAGELQAAVPAYQRVVSLRREISRQSPDNIGNQIALATCLNHLGDLYGGYGFQSLGKMSESLTFYEQAKDLVIALGAKYPANLEVAKESYETMLTISASENAAGKHSEAARDVGDALAQIEKVSQAQPHDTNVKYELGNAESRLGQMLIDARESPAAVPHLARSAETMQRLVNDDPGNASFRRGLSVVEAQWAAALRGAGPVREGVAHNEAALRIAQALSQDAPKSAQYRVDVGVSERKLSEGLLAAGDFAGALRHAQQAGQILCQDEAATKRNPNTVANCGRAQLAMGNAYLAMHDAKAAVPVSHKARDLSTAQSLADPLNALFRSDSARSQTALAAALAQAGDTRAASDAYKEALNSWAMLRQARSMSAEDAHRADEAAEGMAALKRSQGSSPI